MKILTIFLFLFSQVVNANELLLKTEFEKCVALIEQPSNCPKNKICAPAKTGKHASCFQKLGFLPEDCDYQVNGVSCGSKTLLKMFSQFRGCDRLLVLLSEGKLVGQVMTGVDQGQRCEMNGVAVKSESVPLYNLKRDLKGWAATDPVFSYTLDKVIKKRDVVIESFYSEDSLPWKDYAQNDLACYGMTLPDLQQKILGQKRERLMKLMKLDALPRYFPQRHYVGSGGPKDFPIVDQFRTLKEVRICGVNVPPQTSLRMATFNQSDCKSVADGTVMISGIPIALFPSINAKLRPNSLPSVLCGPKARTETDVDDLAQKFEIEKQSINLPKLNWEECECHQEIDPASYN